MAVTSGQDLQSEVVVCQVEKETKSRTKCPGVRVKSGRIYDSDNGKTCHQCRQKTRDFAAECKNLKGSKQCTIKYCHKCLLNRYGEKAEEVAVLDKWICPKCKGICNCSFCMKKKGHKPTGILVHTAKENGFSSVSELLQVKGLENFGYERPVKDLGASANQTASAKDSTIASLKKPGKENTGDRISGSHSQKLSRIPDDKKCKKKRRVGLEGAESSKRDREPSLGDGGKRKPGLSEEISAKKARINRKDEGYLVTKCSTERECHDSPNDEMKMIDTFTGKLSQDISDKGERENDDRVGEKFKKQMSSEVVVGLTAKEKKQNENCKNLGVPSGVDCKIKKDNVHLRSEEIRYDIPLPSGTCLTTVAGMELPNEVVGHALQFFEFCAAFGEALDLKKGQAEAMVREIMFGRRGRRSQGSLLVQFQVKLLSLLLEDLGEESQALSTSWLQALGELVSDSKFLTDEFPSSFFDGGNEKFDSFTTSQKFIMLNFLCDEALLTRDLRSWIENQNFKLAEKEKEAKEKVFAAKEKEKQLKQKVQDEVAKAIIAKNGAPFTISEHDAIVSQIKKEAARAHAEMLEAMGMVSKKKQRSDAVRTDPLFVDVNGKAFWKLKGHSNQSDILLQDAGNWDSVAPEEKWFLYDDEQKQGIEQYISSLRTKRLAAQRVAEIPSCEDSETD